MFESSGTRLVDSHRGDRAMNNSGVGTIQLMCTLNALQDPLLPRATLRHTHRARWAVPPRLRHHRRWTAVPLMCTRDSARPVTVDASANSKIASRRAPKPPYTPPAWLLEE